MVREKTVVTRNTNLIDFLYFSDLQIETADHDAHIPFLKKLTENFSNEDKIWMALLYMGYYQEGSAYIRFNELISHRYFHHLPVTTQRRNLLGGRVIDHLNILQSHRPFEKWLEDITTWNELLWRLQRVWGNGRWASYTTAELITSLIDINVEPTTAEVVNSSGPREGLLLLGLDPTEDNVKMLMKELNVPINVIESLLCDWAGLCKGRFYSGRSIDRQQARILAVEKQFDLRLDELWKIRKEVFPHYTLGELNGWIGINNERLKHYRDHYEILEPEENR